MKAPPATQPCRQLRIRVCHYKLNTLLLGTTAAARDRAREAEQGGVIFSHYCGIRHAMQNCRVGCESSVSQPANESCQHCSKRRAIASAHRIKSCLFSSHCTFISLGRFHASFCRCSRTLNRSKYIAKHSQIIFVAKCLGASCIHIQSMVPYHKSRHVLPSSGGIREACHACCFSTPNGVPPCMHYMPFHARVCAMARACIVPPIFTFRTLHHQVHGTRLRQGNDMCTPRRRDWTARIDAKMTPHL